ncbi:hypothetical protein EI94DRAFT_1037717 [Lactarius quietus]|nr:hypothetical protein EI94DRAFT_1037717 [Lactarius quietus]
MATDHNILSPASVRVFTVLLCVLVHSEFVFLVPSRSPIVTMTLKPVTLVGAGANNLSAAGPDKFLRVVTVFDKERSAQSNASHIYGVQDRFPTCCHAAYRAYLPQSSVYPRKRKLCPLSELFLRHCEPHAVCVSASLVGLLPRPSSPLLLLFVYARNTRTESMFRDACACSNMTTAASLPAFRKVRTQTLPLGCTPFRKRSLPIHTAWQHNLLGHQVTL